MKKFITTILATTAVCTSIIYAQLPNIIRDDMVINGLTLCQSYTQEQMIAALGQPDSIILYTNDSGAFRKYYYGIDYFRVTAEDDYFIDFKVTNSHFRFNNFISVGDPVARVSLLGGIIQDFEVVNYNGQPVKFKNWQISKDVNEDKYYSSSINFVYNNNGNIESISAVYNSLL